MRIQQQNKKKRPLNSAGEWGSASPATRWCRSAWFSARQLLAASAKLCTQYGMWKRGDRYWDRSLETGNIVVHFTNQAISLWLSDTMYFICLVLGLCKFDDHCPWSSSTYSHCYASFCMCQMTQMFLLHSLSSNLTEQLLGLTGKKYMNGVYFQ